MIFAAIGSINGNKDALERVLEAIAEEGILTILHTGNAVAGGPGANEVMALLARHSVVCVQGSLDRQVVRFTRKRDTINRKLDDAEAAAVQRAHEELSSQHLETLRDWRKSRTITLEGISVFLCHGSPANPREILLPDTPLVKMQRQREAARADIILCGGSDQHFSRTVDGALFIAPGPVEGAPGSGCYTLVNTEVEPWEVTRHAVPAP